MYLPIIVTDTPETRLPPNRVVESFSSYLADYPKLNEPKSFVINLCSTEQYLSEGYYCSLLAEARKHLVIPSVNTINDFRDRSPQIVIPQRLVRHLDGSSELAFDCFFGTTSTPKAQRLAKYVFDKFPAPILSVTVMKTNDEYIARIDLLQINSLSSTQQIRFLSALETFTNSTWRISQPQKAARWHMAILHDPNEKTPPSDKKALKHFVKAAEKAGIHAELVTADQIDLIQQYDALFIRETTAISHHTYKLARQAEQLGLVVIDDATSILRCCNKVYLQDAFSYHHVPTPRSEFVHQWSDATCDHLEKTFDYPMVLKLPESAFSLGVYKVENKAQLQERLTQLLSQSALVLVQEFIKTDYDWRIGVLNGKAIYACRYYMARNHWQIYNHSSTKNFSGGFDTLPTFEVPQQVLNAAIKASNVIGKGLYGVDVKQIDKKVYVIEVNDNPSIEHGVEDKYLGKGLYKVIMETFVERLELHGK